MKVVKNQTPEGPQPPDYTAPPDKGVQLLAKLHKLQTAIGYVKKDGKNTQQSYTYATARKILDEVRPILDEQGILVVTDFEANYLDPIIGNSGRPMTHVVVKVTGHFTDIATGEALKRTAFGEGMDSGDKAVMKAQTVALRYLFTQAALISTGDDPEADTSTDKETSDAPANVVKMPTPKTTLAENMAAKPEVYGTPQTLAQQQEKALTGPAPTVAAHGGFPIGDGKFVRSVQVTGITPGKPGKNGKNGPAKIATAEGIQFDCFENLTRTMETIGRSLAEGKPVNIVYTYDERWKSNKVEAASIKGEVVEPTAAPTQSSPDSNAW